MKGLVLCFDSYGEWGGGQTVLRKHALSLRAIGYEILLVCPRSNPLYSWGAENGMRVLSAEIPELLIDWSRRPSAVTGLLQYLAITRQLVGILIKERPIGIYAMGSRSAKTIQLAAALTGTRLCWHAGNLYRPGITDRLLLRGSAAVICASGAVLNQYAPFREAQGKLHLVYNSVDYHLFAQADRGALRRSLGIRESAKIVGVVGRISPAKGQMELVRAVLPLLQEYPHLHLAIVGAATNQDDEYLGTIVQLIRSSPESHRCHLTGWRRDIPEVMCGLDIFALPSVAEPFGVVLIEAMAARCPVVAVARGGVPEIVVADETGLHVPPNDVAAIRDAVRDLLQNPAKAERLGQAGEQRVIKVFDDAVNLPRVQKVLEDAFADS